MSGNPYGPVFTFAAAYSAHHPGCDCDPCTCGYSLALSEALRCEQALRAIATPELDSWRVQALTARRLASEVLDA